jgi:hypothetical protein
MDTEEKEEEIKLSTLEIQKKEMNLLLFQFDKLCRILSITIDEHDIQQSKTPEDILKLVIEHIQSIQANETERFSNMIHPQTIFDKTNLQLSEEQKELLKTVEAMTFQVFFHRSFLAWICPLTLFLLSYDTLRFLYVLGFFSSKTNVTSTV